MRPATRLAATLALAVLVDAGASAAGEPDLETRLRRLERHVARHPDAVGARIQLAATCLEAAQTTLQAGWLARARRELQRSLDAQPSFEAHVQLARAEAFAHRFDEALRWVGAARDTDPTDSRVLALEVEALLGLGRLDEARSRLPAAAAACADFHAAAALGHCLAEAESWADARDAFLRAGEHAREQALPTLQAWALAMAADMQLHGGHAGAALEELLAAEALAPHEPIVLAHRAEALAALGRREEALVASRRALRRAELPDVRRLAHELAHAAGRHDEAARHLRRGLRVLEAPLAAGEIYTAGALADLLVRSGGDPERALELARQQARWRGDREARETLRRAESALDAIGVR